MAINDSLEYDRLVLAYAQGQPMGDAAKFAGVSLRSAHRLRNSPDFKQRVREVRDEMLGEAAGKLAEAATLAVATFRELLAAKNPPAVRLGAARGIMSSLIDIHSQLSLVERVAELEPRQEQAEGSRHNGYLSGR